MHKIYSRVMENAFATVDGENPRKFRRTIDARAVSRAFAKIIHLVQCANVKRSFAASLEATRVLYFTTILAERANVNLTLRQRKNCKACTVNSDPWRFAR